MVYYLFGVILESVCWYFLFFFFLNFLLHFKFWVHVQNMQDSCIGTHMAVCFASFLPFTHIWHFFPSPTFGISPLHPHLAFLPSISVPSSPHRWPSPFPPNRPQCLVLPSLCPCVLIFYHLPMSENMSYFIFFSCVSLLRMMFSRFIHVPPNHMNSSFVIAA